ncbi:hypothetical protein [Thalassotalea ganghwensis]
MEAHGHIEIQWHNNIVSVTTHGPFNVEGISLAYQQLIENIEMKNLSHWYRIDYLDAETLGSPKVMRIIARSYKWSFTDQACQAMALSCATPMQLQMINQYIQQTNYPMEAFQDKEAATAYIEALAKGC